VRARAADAIGFELTPAVLAGTVGKGRVDVADGVPGQLVQLHPAGDRVAEQTCPLAVGGDHDPAVARRVPRRLDGRDAWRDRGVPVDRPQARLAGVAAAPLLDVVLKAGGVASFDQVAPVARTQPDARAREARPGLQIEQPPRVVGVQVGTDDLGDVVPLDPKARRPTGS
jgi:hypothetical protein